MKILSSIKPETGLEMQVLDNEGHPDGKIDKHELEIGFS
jgi:hypothetical protein